MNRQLGVSITWRCNLACVHCLQEGHTASSDMSEDTFSSVLDAAQRAGISGIGLTGGEATLHPNFLEFVEKLSQRGFAWTVTTNAMVLNKLFQAALIQPPKRITISFDGHDESSHDAIRGKGTFSKSSRNTKLLNKTDIPLQLQATLIRPILQSLDGMLDLAKKLQASRLMLAWPIPTPELLERNWFPDYDELLTAKKWHQRLEKKDQANVVFSLGNQLLSDSSNTLQPCPFIRGNQFFVNSQGQQGLCCQMAGVGTNASENLGHISSGLRDFSLENLPPSPSRERPMDRFGCMGCMQSLKKLPSRLLFPQMQSWVQPLGTNHATA